MKVIFLFFTSFYIVFGYAQEPDRVMILHQEAIKEAFLGTFSKGELKQAKSCSFMLELRIKADGRISNAKIWKPDSTSLIFQKREKFLRIIEDKMRVKFYTDSFKDRIRLGVEPFCISLLITNGSLFDYENEPFKCRCN